MGTGPTLQPPRRTSPRVRESRPDDAHALVTDEPSAPGTGGIKTISRAEESAMGELLLGRTYTSDLHVIANPSARQGKEPGVVPSFGGLPSAGGPESAGALAGYGLTSLLAALSDGAPGWTLVRAEWQNRRPVMAGQTVRYEVTVTRVRRDEASGSVLSTRASMLSEDGTVLEQGNCDFATSETPREDAADRYQFGTVEWAKHLVPFLEADTCFTSAITAYDGTIGIACGGNEVHFRLYRGNVLEVTRRSMNGSDFTLEADDDTWVELILGERNDFMERAIKGQFRTKGSGYEYLRMTKALVCIIDAARAAASREGMAR